MLKLLAIVLFVLSKFAIITLGYWNYGRLSDSGVQCMCTHFPDGLFEISLPALIGAPHSEQVVLNLAFIDRKYD